MSDESEQAHKKRARLAHNGVLQIAERQGLIEPERDPNGLVTDNKKHIYTMNSMSTSSISDFLDRLSSWTIMIIKSSYDDKEDE